MLAFLQYTTWKAFPSQLQQRELNFSAADKPLLPSHLWFICSYGDTSNAPAEIQFPTKFQNADVIIEDEVSYPLHCIGPGICRMTLPLRRSTNVSLFRKWATGTDHSYMRQIIPLYRQFRTSQHLETGRLKALQNDWDADMSKLTFLKILLGFDEGVFSSDEEGRVAFPPLIAPGSNVLIFCCAILTGIESRYVIHDLLTARHSYNE